MSMMGKNLHQIYLFSPLKVYQLNDKYWIQWITKSQQSALRAILLHCLCLEN